MIKLFVQYLESGKRKHAMKASYGEIILLCSTWRGRTWFMISAYLYF